MLEQNLIKIPATPQAAFLGENEPVIKLEDTGSRIIWIRT